MTWYCVRQQSEASHSRKGSIGSSSSSVVITRVMVTNKAARHPASHQSHCEMEAFMARCTAKGRYIKSVAFLTDIVTTDRGTRGPSVDRRLKAAPDKMDGNGRLWAITQRTTLCPNGAIRVSRQFCWDNSMNSPDRLPQCPIKAHYK